MSTIKLVFPGQGAQAGGMGKSLFQEFSTARETFMEASEAVGLDLAKICFEDPGRRLELTEYTQPCVLTVSLAAWRVLAAETGVRPAVCAGHSLGEYSALAAAGVMSPADAAATVRRRGRFMQEAVPEGEGGMAAVFNVPRAVIEDCCRQAAQGRVVVPANDNSPEQVVISGHTDALERTLELIKQKGGRGRKLKVSGPFHTGLMSPAAGRLAEVLFGMSFSAPAFPVIANLDASEYPGPDAVTDRLVKQLTSPVKWRESVEEMEGRGMGVYIECGPGTVLAGLIKKTLPHATVMPLNLPEHIAAIAKAVSHEQ